MRGMHRATERRGPIGPRHSFFRPAALRRDEGMTLVELMWALMVFGIAATSIAYGIITATNTVRLNKDRVQAANLASREMEITRSEFMNSGTGAADLGASSLSVNPHPLPAGTAADLQAFTVTRSVQWLPAGSGTSACDGGSTVEYPSLAVRVVVTWPEMGAVQPVESRTVLTPPKGSLNSNLSFVAIKVLRANGSPANGQAVSLSGPGSATVYTADNGCAVFALGTAGTYTAKLATTGYVDNFGVAAPTKTIVAKASTLAQASFNYDKAASITTTFTAPSGGYALPATLPSGFVFYNTGIVPSGTKAYTAAGVSTTLTGLWPYTDGYAMWAGTCTQSDPVKAGGTRSASTVVSPGGTASANLRLYGVSVKAVNVDGDPLAGYNIVATPASSLGCLAPESSNWVVGRTGLDGSLLTSLPAGAWTLSVQGKTALGSWPSSGNLKNSTVPSVIAQISTVS